MIEEGQKNWTSVSLDKICNFRAPDKVRIHDSVMPISSSNPMFDQLLESSYQDDSNKWSNIEFGEEITKRVD